MLVLPLVPVTNIGYETNTQIQFESNLQLDLTCAHMHHSHLTFRSGEMSLLVYFKPVGGGDAKVVVD